MLAKTLEPLAQYNGLLRQQASAPVRSLDTSQASADAFDRFSQIPSEYIPSESAASATQSEAELSQASGNDDTEEQEEEDDDDDESPTISRDEAVWI